MKKRNARAIGVMMACTMAIGQTGMPVIAAETRNKEAVQSQKQELQENLDDVNDKIGDLKSAKQELEDSVAELDGQLNELTGRLETLDQEISAKKKEIKTVKKQLREAKAAETDQYEDMKKRIRYLYENGDYAAMEMLMSSKSIADLLNNAEYITKIAEYDRKMLDKYQKTKQEIKEKETKLQKDYQEAREMKQEVKSQESQVQTVMSNKQEEIQSYTAQISENEQLAQEYANEVEAQNEMLAQIQAAEEAQAAAAAEAEAAREQEAQAAEEAQAAAQAAAAEADRKAQEAAEAQAAAESEADAQAQAEAAAEAERLRQEAEAARQEAEQQQAQAQQQTGSSTESGGSSESVSTGGGGFVWPCPSSYTITSDFGGRESPTAGASSNHQGIDIGAPSGSSIVAAASGTVVVAEYSVSAGNYVIISHGQGVSTVYMHASALYVSPGQTVSVGESIAAVGSTGYSTGAHLHFGVTVNGSYVNPHNYVG